MVPAGSDGASVADGVLAPGVELEPDGEHAKTAAAPRTSRSSNRFMCHLLKWIAST